MNRLTIATATLWCISARADELPNLVRNAGFEELTEDNFARDWRGGEFGKPGENVVIDTQEAHSGGCSAKLGIAPNSFVTCAAASIPVKPNTTYLLTWWCKTEGMQRARGYLFLQTNVAQRVFPDMNQYGTEDWTQHFAEYTTTDDEEWIQPVLTTHDQSGPECWAWFDDVQVYEGRFPEPLDRVWRARKREMAGVSETALTLVHSPDLTVWADTLAARIYPEDGLPEYARPAERVEVSGARREEVFFQLAIIPRAELHDVVLQASDLAGPASVSAESIRWWPVGYANIKTAHRPDTRLGLTPDPLLAAGPIAAPADRNTAFCIGVAVPEGAPRGTYDGGLDLRAGDQTIASVALRLRVFDFELPQDPTFRTLITFSPNAMRPWDARPLDEIESDICGVLHEHGIRGLGATVVVPAKIEEGAVVCDFEPVDRRLAWAIDELGFNAFFLGPMFGGGTGYAWEEYGDWIGMERLSPEFNRYFPQYMRLIAQHLKERGWFDKAYLYLWDEPMDDYFDKLVQLLNLALEADPDYKIWETTSPNHEQFWGIVKAWSVPFSRPHFDEATVETRRRAGDEIWVYNIPATLEAPPQLHRLWFWQAAKYGAVGAQLWNVTFYRGIDPWEEITPEPYPVGRGEEKGLYQYDAGQAIMLYPNRDGEGLPLPCLRLKLLKKGIDDFEYLAILQRRLEEQARRQGVTEPTAVAQERMQEVASALVRDIGRYNLDYAELMRVRTELAEQIEACR